MRKITLIGAAIIAALTLASPSMALEIDEIVARANEVSYYQADDGRAKVHMKITDAQGRERSREFVILRKDDNVGGASGAQKFYVYFSRPSDVNKMAFLVWKHMDKDDDRWLYLPALDLVKRIAASDKRTSFVGSHFFYEDVSGRNPALDNHTLVETSETYYVLESRPKESGSVEFAAYRSWIHKETFLPIKIDYVDEEGQTYRSYEALNVEVIDGYATVTGSRMRDLRTGSETHMTYSGVAYDVGLEDKVFSERYLRNPPRGLLR
jgi:outer membrane lipoprotein-sorting protein